MDENKKSKKKIKFLISLFITVTIVSLLCGCSRKQTFKITFKDYDGTILRVLEIEKGKIPKFDGTPLRDSDDTYEYTFLSWDGDLTKANKDVTYTAVYTSTPLVDKQEKLTKESIDDNKQKNDKDSKNDIDAWNSSYYVNFLDDDKTVIQRSIYKYGSMPSCPTPKTKIVDGYEYTFKSWSPSIHTVKDTQTYTATYTKRYVGGGSSSGGGGSTPVNTDATVKYKDSSNGSTKSIKIPANTTITIDAGSGSITGSSPITLTKNQTLDLTISDYTPTPTAGYAFKGYTYDSATKKFTAEYGLLITVSFDMQGHGSDIPSQTIAAGSKATKPTDPTAAGYVFKGWYKEAACTNEWNFDSDTVSTNRTLYAKWQVTVTFNTQGHGTAPATQTIDINGKATKPTDPTADGYVFMGWYKEATCETEWNFTNDQVPTNTTLYAKWQVTVTFDVQGKGTAPATQTLDINGKATKPTDPTAAGYVFKGWYKEAACTNEWNFTNNQVPTNTTLYAKWVVTVTFNVQGKGTAPKSQTIMDGSKVSKPTDPTVAGYVLEGWYKEAACTNKWDFDSNTVTKDTTLYAKWITALSDKILKAKTIYTDGEAACRADSTNSVISINGIDCYVLKVDGDKAELITKVIYNVVFDATKYTYSESSLKTWMDGFYTDNLKTGHDSDKKDENAILKTKVTYYYIDSVSDGKDLTPFTSGTVDQYVFALDANEVKANEKKFKGDQTKIVSDKDTPYWSDSGLLGFWTAAGCTHPYAFTVNSNGFFSRTWTTNSDYGARPAFWISLD